jgi:hypothetical protein
LERFTPRWKACGIEHGFRFFPRLSVDVVVWNVLGSG